jgi:hypothetical protein
MHRITTTRTPIPVLSSTGGTTLTASHRQPGYTGFFGLLKIEGDIPADLQTWASTNSAVVSAQGLPGVGGEGIVIFDPEDLRAALVTAVFRYGTAC